MRRRIYTLQCPSPACAINGFANAIMASFVHKVRTLFSSSSFSSHLLKDVRFAPSATTTLTKYNAAIQSLSHLDNNFTQQTNNNTIRRDTKPFSPTLTSAAPVVKSFKFNYRRRPIVRKAQSLIRKTDTTDNTAVELALNSVVKIFTVSCSPNYLLPWQNKSQRETMGSGELCLLT